MTRCSACVLKLKETRKLIELKLPALARALIKRSANTGRLGQHHQLFAGLRVWADIELERTP
jgi:hypothetical protein